MVVCLLHIKDFHTKKPTEKHVLGEIFDGWLWQRSTPSPRHVVLISEYYIYSVNAALWSLVLLSTGHIYWGESMLTHLLKFVCPSSSLIPRCCFWGVCRSASTFYIQTLVLNCCYQIIFSSCRVLLKWWFSCLICRIWYPSNIQYHEYIQQDICILCTKTGNIESLHTKKLIWGGRNDVKLICCEIKIKTRV